MLIKESIVVDLRRQSQSSSVLLSSQVSYCAVCCAVLLARYCLQMVPGVTTIMGLADIPSFIPQ